MEIDASSSKKRSREESADIDESVPPTKKQKTDDTHDTDHKAKEPTPPLVMDEDDKPIAKPAHSTKPILAPAPSTGIEKKTRPKKPGLAKVPSNLLEFNGLIVDKDKTDDTKKEEDDDIKKEEDDGIDRQSLIHELTELLAPCSRELIERGRVQCVIWFDEDDDGNCCVWIAQIIETEFDESPEVTSMLVTFPGYDTATYWLPIIYANKWMVFQPNKDILLQDKYSVLYHKKNLIQCKELLQISKEYLSEMSESDAEEYITIKKKRKKKKKKKKNRIKTKRKAVTASPPKRRKAAIPSTTAYSKSDKRLESLNDVDTTTISFCPVSKKHLVLPPDLSSPSIDHSLIEILFSFDTTGSMSSCLDSVRSNLKNILTLLFRDIPSIRISILAHGDYCDARHYYVMRWVDLTTDKDKLLKFVDSTTATGGGDAPECYELVMHNASRQISWSPNCANRSLVIIGDANPHELNGNNPYKLDWREKAKDCASCGIKIYGIHCLGHFSSKNFYETISTISNGLYITLDKIQSFAGMMVALCHREKDLIHYDESKETENYQKEKKEYEELHKSLEEFSVLGLKEILKYNAQKVSGTKYELINRVIDCRMYGNMPRCTECGGGHLRVIYINGKKHGHNGNGRYYCPGFYNGNEYVACLWSGDQTKIKREKWRELDDDDNDDNDTQNKNN